jgi:hypothetical protein
VVVHESRDGSVKDGEDAQGGPHAIGAVPERGRREKMRGEETEIMGVSQRREKRRRGSEYPGAVSTCARSMRLDPGDGPRRVLLVRVGLQ